MGLVDLLKNRAEKGDEKAKNLLAQRDKILQLKNLDRHLRTEVLAAGVSVEETLELIITEHFCPVPEKKDAFIAFIFREGQLGFSDKLRMIRPLARQCYPDLKDLFGCLMYRNNNRVSIWFVTSAKALPRAARSVFSV